MTVITTPRRDTGGESRESAAREAEELRSRLHRVEAWATRELPPRQADIVWDLARGRGLER